MPKVLTLEILHSAVTGHASAFRCITTYQPAGGAGDKVFPPTYEGGKYATEKRRFPENTDPVDCVLLDSVQSQANRMEMALLDAWERGKIKLPVITVDFTGQGLPKTLRITSLDAPHRIADALLRDSLVGSTPFRQSEQGKRLDHVDNRNATALFQLCPTALVFGMWDSTGPKGGLGAKFARAMVSEIVGVNVTTGVKTSSRIDPAQIMLGAGPLFRKPGGGWTINPDEAVMDGDLKSSLKIKVLLYGKVKKKDAWHEMPVLRSTSGKPTMNISEAEKLTEPTLRYRLAKGDNAWIDATNINSKYPDAGRPSVANHGNVTPTIDVRKDPNGNPIHEQSPALFLGDDKTLAVFREHKTPSYLGGVTMDKAIQTTVISLPALRRLRFPLNDTLNPDVDDAARTVLAALAICAATLARNQGCDLRSRCLLVPTESTVWQLIDKPLTKDGEKPAEYTLTDDAAMAILAAAIAHAGAEKIGLRWHEDELSLTPSPELIALIKKSQELAAASAGSEEGE